MAEYIEREAVLEKIESSAMWARSFGELYEVVQDMPAADVASVRHGRWIQCKYMDKSAKCSECGGYYTRFTVNERYPNYCPNCGAKMMEG